MKYPKHHDNKPSVLQTKNLNSTNFVSQENKHAEPFIGTLPTNQIVVLALKHHFF